MSFVVVQKYNGASKVVSLDAPRVDGWTLKRLVLDSYQVPVASTECFYLCHNGRKIGKSDMVKSGGHVRLLLRLPGGKGGFGSMLRAIGAQIEKTTNREACRDLSGRRLRDINEESRLKKWIAKQEQRDVEKQIQRREKLERRLATPKHNFHDPEYEKQRSCITDKVGDAVAQGLSAAQTSKRPAPDVKNVPKKPKLWLGADEKLDCSSSDSEAEDVCSTSSPVAASSSSSSSLMPASTTAEIVELANAEVSEVAAAEPVRAVTPDAVAETPEAPETAAAATTETSDSVTEERVQVNEDEEERTELSDPEVQQSSSDSTGNAISESVAAAGETKEERSEPVNLNAFDSAEALEGVGLDRLKHALIALGMKCGGTLKQRAERLYSVKGIPRDQIDPSLLAKPPAPGKPRNRK